jgi:hypothetical protein
MPDKQVEHDGEPRIRIAVTTAQITPDTSYMGKLRRSLTPQGLDSLPAEDRQRLVEDLAALGTTPAELLREEGGVFGPVLMTTVDLAWSDGAVIELRTDLPPSVEEMVRVANLHTNDTALSYVAMNHILAHTFGSGPLPARLADLVGGSFAQRLVAVYARFLRGEELPSAYRSRTGS